MRHKLIPNAKLLRKLEQLDHRNLLAAIPFGTNPLQPLDVNRDGKITALNALTIINLLPHGDPSGVVGNFLNVSGRDGATSLDAFAGALKQ